MSLASRWPKSLDSSINVFHHDISWYIIYHYIVCVAKNIIHLQVWQGMLPHNIIINLLLDFLVGLVCLLHSITVLLQQGELE